MNAQRRWRGTFTIIGAVLLVTGHLAAELPPPWGTTRPSYGMLSQQMLRGFSFLDLGSRQSMERSLRAMDRVSDQLLQDSGIELTPMPCEAAEAWLDQRTSDLPDATPRAERTLLGLIRLEADLLHRAVAERDPELGAEFKHRRTHVRIRSDQERIFGDYRDVLVGMLVENLNQLSELQAALGDMQPFVIAFPTELRTIQDLEYFAEQSLERLAERSGSLLR